MAGSPVRVYGVMMRAVHLTADGNEVAYRSSFADRRSPVMSKGENTLGSSLRAPVGEAIDLFAHIGCRQ